MKLYAEETVKRLLKEQRRLCQDMHDKHWEPVTALEPPFPEPESLSRLAKDLSNMYNINPVVLNEHESVQVLLNRVNETDKLFHEFIKKYNLSIKWKEYNKETKK